MSAPASPSWYDLLGLDRTASAAEIRAAWKAAIADLDPTDRRFGVYNQAAEVLLDPKRRAAYDAELPAEVDEEEADARADLVGQTEPRESTVTGVEPAAGPTSARRAVPGWVLAAVAVLAALAVVAAGAIWVKVPSDAAVEQSTREAQAAAERAMGPILSYDYRHLDEDQRAAESYMTPHYQEEYDKIFGVLKQNAPNTQTVVKAQVIASGIVRSGTDRVEVFLFVDQPTTNKQTKTPVDYKNQVRAQMQKVGSEWLVDCLITTPNGHCD